MAFSPLEKRIYPLLAICASVQILINQCEQPYARSLVVCDVPLNTTEGAEFSGSSKCGNRNKVIGKGAVIYGWGDTLENMGRFSITLFVSGFADSRGRKAAAVLGWCFILASTLLFQLAGFLESWAFVLFATAQGLQGMSGIGLLSEIVVGDMAAVAGDAVGIYSRRDTVFMFCGTFFYILSMGLQSFEIVNFGPIWGIINVVNLATLILLVVLFPETQLDKDKKDHQSDSGFSLVKLVMDELKAYWAILKEIRWLRWHLLDKSLTEIAESRNAIVIPMTMAYFGYNQFWASVIGLPLFAVGMMCIAIVPMLCKRLGHAKAYEVAYVYDKTTNILGAWVFPLFCYSIGLPFWWVVAVIKSPTAGLDPLFNSILLGIVGSQNNAKIQAIRQLSTFVIMPIGTQTMVHLFDAEATDYSDRVKPFIVTVVFHLAAIFVTRNFCWKDNIAECEKQTLEAEKAEKVQATESEQTAGKKEE